MKSVFRKKNAHFDFYTHTHTHTHTHTYIYIYIYIMGISSNTNIILIIYTMNNKLNNSNNNKNLKQIKKTIQISKYDIKNNKCKMNKNCEKVWKWKFVKKYKHLIKIKLFYHMCGWPLTFMTIWNYFKHGKNQNMNGLIGKENWF